MAPEAIFHGEYLPILGNLAPILLQNTLNKHIKKILPLARRKKMNKQQLEDSSISTKERLPLVWNDKVLCQKEMYRLLGRTLSSNWLDDERLQKKVEKLSYLLAGYTTNEIQILR
jgi:hypothetical protein